MVFCSLFLLASLSPSVRLSQFEKVKSARVEKHEDLARRGVPESQLYIGYRRLLGRGVERDPLAAFNNFEAAAANGDALAKFHLGFMHLHGISTPKNYTAARHLFEEAAWVGLLPAAWNGLGVLYFYGWGCPKNYTLAWLCFLKAAEDNYSDALCNLGNMYLAGNGVEKNDTIAFAYFQRAMNADEWRAPYMLALMYSEGRGTPLNYSEAARHMKIFIAERGSWSREMESAVDAQEKGDHWGALMRYTMIAEQLAFIEAEEQLQLAAAAARLQAEEAATAEKLRLQADADADAQARRKEAEDLLQRHEANSIERLKFCHFEPNGDNATPEEQHKEFLSKLWQCPRDIITFAAPTTISSQLDTLKTEVQQLQSTNSDGNPKQYKMPTFQLEKFDDYTHQDPLLWWEAFTTQLRTLPVAKHAYIGALFMNSKGRCQIWLTHLAATHSVDVADLKDKITWEELTRLWKKRLIVVDAPALAVNRLFTMSQGNTATHDWLTEWQKIATVPDLDLPFTHLRREFYNRSCAELSQALGDREQYATFVEIIDKAREIIKTNNAAAHEKSTWQPTCVEKVRTGPRQQQFAAVQSDTVEDPTATQASREGDQVAAVQPRSNKPRVNGKAKPASLAGNGQPAPPWVKFGLTEAEYKYRNRYGCCYCLLPKPHCNVLKAQLRDYLHTAVPTPLMDVGVEVVDLHAYIAKIDREFKTQRYDDIDAPLLYVRIQIGEATCNALIDCGASRNYMSPDFMVRVGLGPRVRRKAHPTQVTLADGHTHNSIDWCIDDIPVYFAPHASEAVSFDILDTKFDMILGMSWLRSKDHPVNFYRRTVHRRYKLALDYSLRLAALDHEVALVEAGDLHYYGLVEGNQSDCLRYYEHGAALNDPEALYSLAYLYEFGIHVEQNFTKARELLDQALSIETLKAEVVPLMTVLIRLWVHHTCASVWRTLSAPVKELGGVIEVMEWDTVVIILLSFALGMALMTLRNLAVIRAAEAAALADEADERTGVAAGAGREGGRAEAGEGGGALAGNTSAAMVGAAGAGAVLGGVLAGASSQGRVGGSDQNPTNDARQQRLQQMDGSGSGHLRVKASSSTTDATHPDTDRHGAVMSASATTGRIGRPT
ncbi:hypothetical protein CBR_g39643 [Chara braunii]|uniref:Uncharacterized protein n=1 Tax=Chara braunii TaxID=69332 RepID=A0A388K1D4_CHABU|nr:hypothetical protein CBR_g39643 [Chara braunii]|eukprot:GBG63861.1 hypothetical protein CBR_g39643 [Chara braunii]